MKSQMVNFMGEKITQQAYLIALAGIVLAVIVVALTLSMQGVVIALALLLSFFIYAYNVNCTIVGKCHVWAWLLTILYILNALTVGTGLLFVGK
jgi:Na+-translocating ferredoxin:NAD+ oxidoreductase RnfE subunit